MSLGAQLQEILDLQHRYTSDNSEEMKARGLLIRKSVPDEIRPLAKQISDAMGTSISDLLIEGRDATGLKSEVPWVRVASHIASPRATTGWYVVYLFRREGAGAYLVLAHGSTTPQAGAFVPRSDIELADLMRWGRDALKDDFASLPGLLHEISLATKQAVPKAYEKSSLAALYYPSGAIPDDEHLKLDLLTMTRLLGKIYEADRLGRTPHSHPPEQKDLETAISQVIQPNKPSGGLRFILTAEQRKAVELHAMNLAVEHLRKLGFSVKDVSAKESFDLLATSSSQVITVEVKGTTGLPGSIALTANEVTTHQIAYPNNALVVVHGIELHELAGKSVASGGQLMEFRPWLIDTEQLRAIAFTYRLDRE
jgi:hypothetical protein